VVGSYCGSYICGTHNNAPIRCNYFPLCLQAINGAHSTQKWKTYTSPLTPLLEERGRKRGKRAWVVTEWIELAEWKGRRLPKLCGAEVNDWNESRMQYQGSAWGTNAAPGTKWSENGNHILQAHGQTNNYMFFIFCTTVGGWGNLEALRAAERGKSVDFVRLLYIIRLWASLLICRQARERP